MIKHIVRTIIVLVFSAALLNDALAQDSGQVHVQAMKKLEFLVGEWEGKAEYRQRDGSVKKVQQYENVQWELGNTILLVKGVGKTDENEIVHNAMGILSYNPHKETYQLVSYLDDGKSQISNGEFNDDGSFSWGFDTPNGSKIKYTVMLTDQNKWHEKGEFSRDGENWNKFIEMTLEKKE